jgi:hypothetical protein
MSDNNALNDRNENLLGRVAHGNGDFSLDGLNAKLGEHQGSLCFMYDTGVESILVGNFDHQVAKQFFGNHVLYLLEAKAATQRDRCMASDKLRGIFDFFPSLMEDNPWFLQIFVGRCTLQKEFQILCRCVPAICESAIKIDGVWRTRWPGNKLMGHSEIHKSALTNYIVIADQTSLNYLYTCVNQNQDESSKSHQVFWLLPISLFILSIIGFYHGFPGHSLYGFLIVAAASIVVIVATIFALGLWLHLPLIISENAFVSLKIGVSASAIAAPKISGLLRLL